MPFFSSFSSSFFAGRRSTTFSPNLWEPLTETSLIAWWDASDPAKISSSIPPAGPNILVTLSDGSSNGNALNAVNTPTITTLNGLDAIDFDGEFSGGSDRALTAVNTDFTVTDGNIIIVGALNIDGVGNENDSIWSIRDDDGSPNDIHLRAGNATSFLGAFECNGLGSGGLSFVGGNTRTWSDGPYSGNIIHATICDFSGNDIYGRMNGTQRINVSNEYLTPVNMSNSTFLLNVNRTGDRELDGQFAELMIFNSNNQALAIKAEGYLAHKWGMTSLLPSGHLYKTSPP